MQYRAFQLPLFVSFFLLVLMGCQGTSKSPTELETLTEQRDSLKTLYADLGEQLSEVEQKIYKLEKEKGLARKVPVSTQQLVKAPFEHFVEVQGGVQADKNVVLTVEVAGAIKKIHVDEGDRVRMSQTLVSLDTDILEENRKELKEQLDLARFVHEKQERLWKQNIGSELEYRQTKNRLKTLETKLSSLNAQILKGSIRAPFSGTIDQIVPRLGEMVSPGMPVIRLVNLDKVNIEAEISEKYVTHINKNSKAMVHFPATGEQAQLNIKQVGNYINPNNRTFRVVAELENKNKNYLPNMVARVMVRDYYNENAIVVPSKVVMQDLNNQDYVYVLENGQELPTVKRVNIETGHTYQDRVEVIGGLNGGETLVVEGARSVRPGDIVTVID